MVAIPYPPERKKTIEAALQNVPITALREFCKLHQVRELSLFGSAVRGELGPDSDLDILVAFEPDARIGFLTMGRIARELSELLGRPVDLVPKDGLKPGIRASVLAEAETLVAA